MSGAVDTTRVGVSLAFKTNFFKVLQRGENFVKN